jgi:ABC-type spermidine/putrescine transport system permease subunit I
VTTGARPRGWLSGKSHWLALLPFIAIILFVFLVPTLRMLSRGFLEPHPGLDHFVEIFEHPLYRQVLYTTLRVSTLVTILAIILAFPVALLALRSGPVLRGVIFALVLVPFWTSLLVRVYGWTFLLQRTGVINSALTSLGIREEPLPLLYNEFSVVLGILHYMLPFMVLTIYVALRSIDPSLRPAAAVLGARPLRAFFKVTVPLAMPGVIAGTTLVFIGSIGFFVTPALMGSPRETMIANLITFQVKDALNWPRAAALATVLVCAVSLLASLYFAFLDKSRQSGSRA